MSCCISLSSRWNYTYVSLCTCSCWWRNWFIVHCWFSPVVTSGQMCHTWVKQFMFYCNCMPHSYCARILQFTLRCWALSGRFTSSHCWMGHHCRAINSHSNHVDIPSFTAAEGGNHAKQEVWSGDGFARCVLLKRRKALTPLSPWCCPHHQQFSLMSESCGGKNKQHKLTNYGSCCVQTMCTLVQTYSYIYEGVQVCNSHSVCWLGGHFLAC